MNEDTRATAVGTRRGIVCAIAMGSSRANIEALTLGIGSDWNGINVPVSDAGTHPIQRTLTAADDTMWDTIQTKPFRGRLPRLTHVRPHDQPSPPRQRHLPM